MQEAYIGIPGSRDARVVATVTLAGMPIEDNRTAQLMRKGRYFITFGYRVDEDFTDAELVLAGLVDAFVAAWKVNRTLMDGNGIATEDLEGDLCGHGTACAGVIRSLAPEAELYSVRVLGAGFKGSGKVLLAGLKWAVEQGYDVINMSLSTQKRQFAELLHELADSAYFKRTVLVAAAHNMPVESYPWRFSSVISVGSHEDDDPFTFFANPNPPVEFFARGVNVDVAWLGGSTIRATGNSFATPCISGISALVLSKHPQLTPFQLKSVLFLISSNVGGGT
jgi:subtilisin family serine protease